MLTKNFIVSIICLCSLIQAESAIRTLYENKDFINAKLAKCEDTKFRGMTFPYSNTPQAKFWNSMQDKPLVEWRKKSTKLISITATFAIKFRGIDAHVGTLLNDDKMVNLFISFLADTSDEGERIQGIAYRHLLQKTSYKQIQKNSDLIKAQLNKPHVRKRLSNIEYYDLFLLCDLSEEEKKEVLKEKKYLPPYYRAKLGEKEAMDTLILQFRSAKDFNAKAKLAKKLSFVGTDETLKELIVHFYDDLYMFDNKGWISNSIQHVYIKYLQKHFPNEPLLNEDLEQFTGLNQSKANDSTLIKPYFEKIIKWGKAKYGVSPERKKPKYYALQGEV